MDSIQDGLVSILAKFAPWIGNRDRETLMHSEIREIGLDSMSLVSAILELEIAFDVTFTDDLMTYEVFRTPATIENAIRTLAKT